MLRWSGDRVAADVEARTGRLLVRAAVTVQSSLRKSLSTLYPPASKEHEYPRQRTGNLRESVAYEPTDPRQAGRLGRVRVGYAVRAWYGARLELAKNRLGVRAAVEGLRAELANLGVGAS